MTEGTIENLHFSRVALIGVGMIGGSLALALRERGIVDEVVGVGRGKENLEDAKRLKIIDSFTHDPAEAVENSELVILATPVQAIPSIVSRMSDRLSPGTLITDVASTKAKLIQEVESLVPEHSDFVPAHPIAGTEKSGAPASDAGIFRNRWTILTPNHRTRPEALEKIKAMWIKTGAMVEVMDAALHDRLFAAISHLPHILAYALVDTIERLDQQEPILRFSAGGFEDFVRIAGSSPEMWRDICLENSGPINEMIGLYMARLQRLGTLIENGDGGGMLELFAKSRGIKEGIEK